MRLKFLPTPSARRATPSRLDSQASDGNFYPRPPRGGRHGIADLGNTVTRFLPTPSARRATPDTPTSANGCQEFLPTPSARRATTFIIIVVLLSLNFYPRPPRGGRQGERQQKGERQHISTHALREEGDKNRGEFLGHGHISTHALREEGDCGLAAAFRQLFNFYPRPPRGGRPQ